ncbi:MAG: WYL domain-containing protein [Prevotella sp.]|nr:WYL domain-containing protein [Prevotella sp.]
MDIDFNEFFKDVVGVTIPEDHPEVENVVLKFDAARFPYVINKPIHHSQIVLDEKEHTIQLAVRPNKELEARIFSYGNQVEVLEPSWLREQIFEKFKQIVEIYSTVQKDRTIQK